jgi:hypothetical protein
MLAVYVAVALVIAITLAHSGNSGVACGVAFVADGSLTPAS